jgi:hypothetical protein
VIFVHVFVMPAGQKSAGLGTAASQLKLSLEVPTFQQPSVPSATTDGQESVQLPDFWEQDQVLVCSKRFYFCSTALWEVSQV